MPDPTGAIHADTAGVSASPQPQAATGSAGQDDRLQGDAGDDLLRGAAGSDVLDGGLANDTLYGEAGDDHLDGGEGRDVLYGGSGTDRIDGGADSDRLFGGDGNDLIRGSAGADLLVGGDGADTLDGGDGNDRLRGHAGNDLLEGGNGADALFAGEGDDTLDGGGGNDRLYGGEGADVLHASAGNDLLCGGAGDDTFHLAASDPARGATEISGGDGHDTLVVALATADATAGILAEFAAFTAGERFVSATLGATLEGIEAVRFVHPADPGAGETGADDGRIRVDDKRIDDQPGITMPGSGRAYVPILEEGFDYATFEDFLDALNDGTSGIWSTSGKNGGRDGTGPHSIKSDPRLLGADGEPLDLNPFELEGGVLSIRAGLIPDETLDDVLFALDTPYSNNVLSTELPYQHANDPDHEGGVDYFYSGALNTHQSWGATYGYFEIKAKLPEGTGFFPAFWLTNVTQGWPPELDIIEAVGNSNELLSTVIFNRFGQDDRSGEVVYDLDLVNDRGLDFAYRNEGFDRAAYEDGAYAIREGNPYHDYVYRTTADGGEVKQSVFYEIAAKDTKAGHYSFKTAYTVEEELYRAGQIGDVAGHQGMMFTDSLVYAAEWTPDEIIWYVGLDSDHLVEVFRSETPADVTTAQYVMANLEFGGSWPGYPLQSEYEAVFGQSMDIDHIKIYALAPDNRIEAGANAVFVYGEDERQETVYADAGGDGQGAFQRTLFGSDRIVGNARANVIEGGSGLDEFIGGAGADTFVVRGDQGNKIILDFDPGEGDTLLLEGFHIDGVAGALATLTQVGEDVWLIKGADPHNPQTVILRDITISEIGADAIRLVGSVSGSAQEDPAIFKVVNAAGEVHGTAAGDRLKSNFRTDDGEKVGGVDLHGGEGEDVYLVRNTVTRVVEHAGEGIDTIQTNYNYVLPDNVENLVGLAGSRGQVLTGNALDNRIEGTSQGDTVTGLAGNDYLDLSAGGEDVVHYGAGDGADVIEGFGADDQVVLGVVFADFADLASRLVAAGRDTVLLLEDGEGILFRDTAPGELDADNFAFETGAADWTAADDPLAFLLF